MPDIRSLNDFYDLMFQTKDIRRQMTLLYLNGQNIPKDLISELKKSLNTLTAIADQKYQCTLQLDEKKTITTEISYEIQELKKDMFFLSHTEEEFLEYLTSLHKGFRKEVETLVSGLKNSAFRNFITDRDGTVSNYCARYASSVQSVYNAVFLTRFAQSVENAVILTSAPLDNIGLADISVSPQKAFIFAGSKGREYFDKNNRRCQFPIEERKQEKLNGLNAKLSNLVKDKQYEMFSLIGSGLQFKFGQTTIARQDISGSIPEQESLDFLKLIEDIVLGIDPKKEFFRIEDTGKDIEIILTVEQANDTEALKDFDKGDGVRFLDQDLSLNLTQGPNLICGDTSSDLPMIPAALEKCPDTKAVIVTTNEDLKKKALDVFSKTLFVSEPDILVTALNLLAN